MNKPISKTYQRPSPYHISKKELKKAQEEAKYSPDLCILEQYEHQLLFVYDELMPMHRNHALVEGATDSWTAFTLDNYSMFKKKLGEESWPIAFDKRFSYVPFTKIKGELYALRPGRFKEIDSYYKNGVDLQRRRVKLIIPSLAKSPGEPWKYRMDTCRAWMYVAIEDQWLYILDHGYSFKPVKTFHPKSLNFQSYYYFTTMELKA